MRRIRTTLLAACAVVALTAGTATAQVTADRRTFVTFSGPVSIPGATLPAGTYTFKIADSQANRHIVQIFDKDESKIYATILAVAAERPEASGDPVITFKETASTTPPAVHFWYYAGEKEGNEIVYPKSQAMMIAKNSGEAVMSIDCSSSNMRDCKGDVSRINGTGVAESSSSSSASSMSSTTASSATTTASSASSTTVEPTQPPVTTSATSATSGTTASSTTQPTTTTTTAPEQPVTTSQPPPPTPPVTTSTSTTTAPANPPVTPPTSMPEITPPPAAPATTAPVPPTVPIEERTVGTSGRTEALPKTASQLPLVGLIGLLSLGAALALRTARA